MEAGLTQSFSPMPKIGLLQTLTMPQSIMMLRI